MQLDQDSNEMMDTMVRQRQDGLLNAAGTPIITPLPCASSLDKLTLLPGESSTKSRSGIRSLTDTNAGLVA